MKDESEMLRNAVVITLCTGAIGFYTRFLMALYKECKPRRSGYWMRLRLASKQSTVVVLHQDRSKISRPA